MKKLAEFLNPYKKETVLGPLFKLFEALLELFVPLVIAEIIDTGIAKGNEGKGYILSMMLLLVLLAAVGLIFSVVAQYFAAKASVGFVTGIRGALFKHIGKLSYTDLDKVGSATLITRMTADVNQVQTGMNLALRLLLRSPFVVFGATVMAFTIDKRISLIFLSMIAILSIVVFGVMLITMPLHKKVQASLDSLTHTTRENLAGVRVIRAFCKEEDEFSNFIRKNNFYAKMERFTGRISALTNPITFIVVNFSIAILIWKGALRVSAGTLTQGQVVALYNYMSQILVELVKLANLIVSISKAIACAGRVSEVFDIPEISNKGEEYQGGGSVEFDNVSFKYQDAGDMSLKNISFKAEKGDCIGIIGGTGDGKTTLVNLILGFYEATTGSIYINGKNVRSYSKTSLASRIGVVPQKALLFSGSIRENMQWAKPDATDEEILQALEIAEAKDFVMAKEGGLDFVLEQGGKNLSGGQRQRLSVARALVGNPEILILDDSSSALDYITDSNMRRNIANLEYKPTVFIVSQRASSVMSADNIIVLSDGEAVGQGVHSELMESCEVYREIYETQFEKGEE